MVTHEYVFGPKISSQRECLESNVNIFYRSATSINDAKKCDKIKKKKWSYSDRLLKFGLTTLLERIIRGDLIETFKNN